MYTIDSVDELKLKVNLLEVAEQFAIFTKKGANYVAKCVFHKDATPSLYIDVANNRYKCFGCGKSGGDGFQFIQDKLGYSYPEALRYLADKYNITLVEEGKQTYVIPEWKNNTELSPKIVKWFEGRKISQKTLLEAKVTEGIESMPIGGEWKDVNTIHFNYFRNGELVNTKHRGAWKTFKLVKGAELILYNLDSLKEQKEAFIVEGEPDALSLIEAGYKNVVSVPNGASEHRNNLIYINNCIKDISHIEKWHLGLDNDSNGRKLREELAERLGKDKCDYIEWKDKKDASDVLKQYGIQGVIDCCSKPVKFPLEGAFTISDFDYEIADMYKNGLDTGVKIGLKDFHLSIVKGYITVITGLPGSGKSECLDEIGLRLTIKHQQNGAFYSPENKPTQLHYSKMARRIIGKNWSGTNRITIEENKSVQDFLERKIWFIKPEKDFSLTSILKSVRDLQIRHGLDYFGIDAWNKLEHKDNDTHAVGKALDELALFCESYNLHCFLVAHPSKPQVDRKTGETRVPSMYDISGSANFYNKSDNGIAISVNRQEKTATWHILKVKFSHWGWVGDTKYCWDPESGRYYISGYPDNKNWLTGKNNTKENELPLETDIADFDKEEYIPF